jgi:hypothetical protein
LRIEEYHLFLHIFRRETETFGRNQQFQSFSTSGGRVIARQIQQMSPIQGEISHRKRDPHEMLLLSAGKLFQNVGYIQASICRIASSVNAPNGSFYNLLAGFCRFCSLLSEHGHMALPGKGSANEDLASKLSREPGG